MSKRKPPSISSKISSYFNKIYIINKQEAEENKTSLLFLLFSKTLFYFGAIGISAQGLYTIPAFFKLVSAVPGLAFLSTPPLALSLICSAFLFYYIQKVEQEGVFKKPFLKLLANYNNIEGIDNLDKKTDENYQQINHIKNKYKLINQTDTLNPDSSTAPDSSIKPSLYKRTKHKLKQNGLIKLLFGDYLGSKIIYFLAISQISLRMTVSVGVKMLGAQAMLELAASFFGVTLPPATLLISVAMVVIGFLTSNSQNLPDILSKARNDFGEKIKTRDDHEKSVKELKKYNKLAVPSIKEKFKTISSDISPEKYIPQSSEPQKNKLRFTGIFGRIVNFLSNNVGIVFWPGAIGSSMTAFLAIDKFFGKMGQVPYVNTALSIVPMWLKFVLKISNARFVLSSEQPVYKYHLKNLLEGFAERFSNKNQGNQYTSRDRNNIKIIKLNAKILTLDEEIKKLHQQLVQKEVAATFPSKHKQQWLKRSLFEIDKKKIKIPSYINPPVINQDEVQEEKYNPFWYYFALVGTVILLSFRAMSNVSTAAQGLDKALEGIGIKFLFAKIALLSSALTVMSLYGLIKLPVILLTLAFMGYVSKSANNFYKHIYNTLSIIFGVSFKYDSNQQNQHIKELRKEKNDKLNELRILIEKLPPSPTNPTESVLISQQGKGSPTTGAAAAEDMVEEETTVRMHSTTPLWHEMLNDFIKTPKEQLATAGADTSPPQSPLSPGYN